MPRCLPWQGVGPRAAECGVLALLDTAGCDMEEVQEEEGDSTSNPGEAQVRCLRMQRCSARPPCVCSYTFMQ